MARVVEERAMFATARAVREYKDSDSFETGTAMATIGTYILGFDDHKKKVTEAYLTLNLHHITVLGKEEGIVEEEEESAKGGEIVEEWVVRKVVLMRKSSRYWCLW